MRCALHRGQVELLAIDAEDLHPPLPLDHRAYPAALRHHGVLVPVLVVEDRAPDLLQDGHHEAHH
eukprot:9222232-Alexandrium_andersonii.AAC.1